MKEIKRIIFSGGGTGGHIYPAMALYRRMKEKNPELEVLYIGTKRGLESSIVPKAGLNFASIEIEGIKRSLSLENLLVGYKMLAATHKAKKIIREFNPDVVVGTGGYVCGPVILAASRLGIPTLIHEQNSIAGITNKFLARFVDKIAICFDDVRKDFKKYTNKIQLTGNPRGQEACQIKSDPMILSREFDLDNSKRTLLIFGGSRGAPAINQAALEGIDHWLKSNYQVIIVTGRDHYSSLDQKKLEEINSSANVRVLAYIDNMPELFPVIDLVVCRAGATTLTELTALSLPSILIPSPYVTANHQESNAQSLVKESAAEMILEKDLNHERLEEMVDRLMHDGISLDTMSKNAGRLGIRDASDRIIKLLENIKD